MNSSSRRASLVRAWVFAFVLVLFGGALVTVGAFVDGYLQSTCLEIGAATLLVSPLLLVERQLDQMVDLRVEDGVARALNDEPSPQPAGLLQEQVTRALSDMPFTVVAVENGSLNHVVEAGDMAIGIVVKAADHPIDAASIQRLVIETFGQAARTGLVVVTNTHLTGLAQDWLGRNATNVRVVRWAGPETAALLTSHLRELASRTART
jgi:hypothetical protein